MINSESETSQRIESDLGYEPPVLVRLGSIRDLTLATLSTMKAGADGAKTGISGGP